MGKLHDFILFFRTFVEPIIFIFGVTSTLAGLIMGILAFYSFLQSNPTLWYPVIAFGIGIILIYVAIGIILWPVYRDRKLRKILEKQAIYGGKSYKELVKLHEETRKRIRIDSIILDPDPPKASKVDVSPQDIREFKIEINGENLNLVIPHIYFLDWLPGKGRRYHWCELGDNRPGGLEERIPVYSKERIITKEWIARPGKFAVALMDKEYSPLERLPDGWEDKIFSVEEETEPKERL